MIEIFNENEVTAKNIAQYMVSVGMLDDADYCDDTIEISTEDGWPYFIWVCNREKYIKILISFCANRKKTTRLRSALKKWADSGPEFFSTFSNGNEETYIQCVVSYEHGLLPKQFISMLNRFDDFISGIEKQFLTKPKPLISA